MRRVAFVIAVMTAVVGGPAAPAVADVTVDRVECLAGAAGTLRFGTTDPVLWGDRASVSWTTSLPAACSGAFRPVVTLVHDGTGDALQPSPMTVSPAATGTWTLRLKLNTGDVKDLASAAVTVKPDPVDRLPAGQPDVTIVSDAGWQRRLFVEAVKTPGTTVHVARSVNLDLSGLAGIPVATGVHLLGTYPAGLYTRTFPTDFLTVAGDDVVIDGLRIDGRQPADPNLSANTVDAGGISINGAQNVTIAENEIFGWRAQAIGVWNTPKGTQVPKIIANFIHDNQHPIGSDGSGAGYGVVVYSGASVLVERNVFDRDRHALSGRDTSREVADVGYTLNDNLFLRPGLDRVGGGPGQVIDMHGTGCHYDCGLAGGTMILHANTITSTGSPSVLVRGTPSDGTYLDGNIFAADLDSAIPEKNRAGLHLLSGNVFGSTAFNRTRTECDFDGDGVTDTFMATGATWWHTSSRLGGRWLFDRESTLPLSAVTLTPTSSGCRATPGVTVPSIIGLNRVTAAAALGGVGLRLGSEHDWADPNCDDGQANTISGQNPGPGTVVPPGTSVNFDFAVPPRRCP